MIAFLKEASIDNPPKQVAALEKLLKNDNLNENHEAEKILRKTLNTITENLEEEKEEIATANRKNLNFSVFMKKSDRETIYQSYGLETVDTLNTKPLQETGSILAGLLGLPESSKNKKIVLSSEEQVAVDYLKTQYTSVSTISQGDRYVN